VHALHQGYLRGFKQQGGTLWCEAELAKGTATAGQWDIELADGRSVRCRTLVNAAGAWADDVAKRCGALPLYIQPKRRSAFTFLAPPRMDVRNWPTVADVEERWYFKPDAGQLLGSPANADPVAAHDVVITTALIPGRRAPILLTREMVEAMPPGSVVVDLAAERGGNCELAKPDEVVDAGGVKIVGYTNFPGRLAASASALYAKNLYTFLEVLIDKKTKQINLNWDDDILKSTALTRDGAVVHPSFAPKTAA